MKPSHKVNIEKIINKVLNETLEEKADKLKSNIKKGLEEDLGGMEDTHPTFGDFTPEDMEKFVKKHLGKKHSKHQEDEPYVLPTKNDDESEQDWEFGDIFEGKTECSECGGMIYEGECSECGWKSDMSESEEVGKFPEYQEFDYVAEGEDDMMSKVTKVCKEEGEDSVACKKHKEYAGVSELGEGFDSEEIKFISNDEDYSDENFYPIYKWNRKNKNSEGEENFELEVEEGNAFTKKLKDTPKGGKFKLGDKTYTDTSDLNEKECVECGSKYPVVEKWEGDVEVEKTGEHADKTIEQINTEIKSLKKKSESYKDKGQKVPMSIRKKMSELYFAKRAKQGWKGKGKAKVKESISLTENELITLIENIINEEETKKVKNNIKTSESVKGLKKYKQAFDASGKENEDYLKSVTKKMKDYLKDGSKGEYSMEPKNFPQGNGELAKMSKKAYVPSDAVKDYTDNLTAAGLENLDYDEIHPNEEWVTKNIEGSSETGNNPEWANAVETPVNKKRNKIRKDNLLGKIKRKAYNKAPQPIIQDKSGEDAGEKLMMKLESENPKNKQKLDEEFKRMSQLFSYDKKTQ
jgi:hypothetical protein